MTISPRTRRAPPAVLLALVALAAAAPAVSSFIVPDAADLRIKTRQAMESPRGRIATEIVALKGARQRRESIVEFPARPGAPRQPSSWIRITQCDERRTLEVNDVWRTYAYEPITDLAAEAARLRAAFARQPRPPETAAGPLVTITSDAVDTGERRTYGTYSARHVITTRKTEPSPGALTPASVDETDGWYLDLPDTNCQDGDGPTYSIGVALTAHTPGTPIDRIEFKQRGTARRGFPIEETSRTSGGGRNAPQVVRVQLLEISEAPVDPALFNVPPGYRPALPDVYGGYDMSKPDTFLNRVELYERAVADWANRVFSFRPRSY